MRWDSGFNFLNSFYFYMILIREMVLNVDTLLCQASVSKMMQLRTLFRLIDTNFINKNLECESALAYLRLWNIATEN